MAKQEIEVFLPQLPNTPGWTGLAQNDREWLTLHTSNAVTNFRESGLKAIQACAELSLIRKFLADKTLTFTNWVRSSFGSSERTAYRWLASYEQLRGAAADEAVLYLAQEGIAGINNTVQPRELAPVLKALPPPRDLHNKKAMEAWKTRVGEELRQRRSRRRTQAPLELDPDDALRVFVLTTDRLMRECRLQTSAEARAWLRKGGGYVMQKRAVSGSVTLERLPIPDGFLPRRGRPRKQPPEAAK